MFCVIMTSVIRSLSPRRGGTKVPSKQWRNHTRAITGSARDEFISARVESVLKMSMLKPNEIFLLRTAM